MDSLCSFGFVSILVDTPTSYTNKIGDHEHIVHLSVFKNTPLIFTISLDTLSYRYCLGSNAISYWQTLNKTHISRQVKEGMLVFDLPKKLWKYARYFWDDLFMLLQSLGIFIWSEVSVGDQK